MEREEIIDILKESRLFAGLEDPEIGQLLGTSSCRVREFEKGQQVFREGDRPESEMILLAGSILIARDTFSGRRMMVTRVERPGGIFGEIYVFAGLPAFDMYGEAVEASTVLFIRREAFEPGRVPGLDRRVSEVIARNQTGIFAQKAYGMNRRLRILGSASIREKIARFLIEQAHARTPGMPEEGSLSCGSMIRVMPREEMADYLNVTRPSLSRELSTMAKEGILEIDGRDIRVLDAGKLEECL